LNSYEINDMQAEHPLKELDRRRCVAAIFHRVPVAARGVVNPSKSRIFKPCRINRIKFDPPKQIPLDSPAAGPFSSLVAAA
jgi:hypothetical protein